MTLPLLEIRNETDPYRIRLIQVNLTPAMVMMCQKRWEIRPSLIEIVLTEQMMREMTVPEMTEMNQIIQAVQRQEIMAFDLLIRKVPTKVTI